MPQEDISLIIHNMSDLELQLRIDEITTKGYVRSIKKTRSKSGKQKEKEDMVDFLKSLVGGTT